MTGEPGIGKSRLLAGGLSRITDRRAVIAAGRASEFERQLPFSVLVDALDAYLGSVAGRRLATLGDLYTSILARVFPSLAQLQESGSRSIEPTQLNHALRALLTLLASEQSLVLVLDDVHWADQASVELIVHLLHRPVPATKLVIAFRPSRASGLLRHSVHAACNRGVCTEIGLGPLTQDEAERLLGPVRSAERRREIYRESGGNPFYLEQLARAESGEHQSAAAELSDVPAGVARALAAELGELPAGVRAVVDAAAVAGEPFGQELVSAISGVDLQATRDALDQAVARGLAIPTPVPGRFVFRHPIVRRAVYASAAPAWLLGAHERAAEALRLAGAAPATRAHHVELSGRIGADVVDLFVAVGRESARVAPASAVRWYQAAVRAQPADSGPEHTLALIVPLATALTAAGQLQPARETLGQILDLLPADEPAGLRAGPLVAMAVIERVLGGAGEVGRTLTSVVERLAGEQSLGAAALHLELAADRYFAGDWPAMGEHAQTALTQASEQGGGSLVAAASAVLGLAEINSGQVRSARRRVAEAARLIDRMPDEEARLHLGGIHWLGWCEHHLERYDDVLRHYERGLKLGARSGQRHLLIPMLLGFAIADTWTGNLGRATESAQGAIDSAQLVGAEPLIQLTFALRCWLAVRAGGLPEAISACAVLRRSLEHDRGPHALLTRTWLGEALIENGEPRTGLQMILTTCADKRLSAIELAQHPYLCELLTRAELAVGARAEAERWALMASDAAGMLDLSGASALALRARAELALANGDAHGAAKAALDAVAIVGDSHPLERERSRLLAGRALAAIGDPAAVEVLNEAHTRLGEFGANRLQAHAARELRALGRRVTHTIGRSRRSDEDGDVGELAELTDRELEVAMLVAEHLTNRQIAERLVISPKTVEHHIEHIFAKLGVSSRGAVARLVLRQRPALR